jgi:hypothetical protein
LSAPEDLTDSPTSETICVEVGSYSAAPISRYFSDIRDTLIASTECRQDHAEQENMASEHSTFRRSMPERTLSDIRLPTRSQVWRYWVETPQSAYYRVPM